MMEWNDGTEYDLFQQNRIVQNTSYQGQVVVIPQRGQNVVQFVHISTATAAALTGPVGRVHWPPASHQDLLPPRVELLGLQWINII